MTEKYYMREGTTEPITVTLKDGTTGANITGYSAVSVWLRSADGTVVSGTTAGGGVSVTTAGSGILAINPGSLSTPLLYSKNVYYGYFTVTDGTGKLSKFPNGEEFQIVMKEKYTGDS